LPTFSFGEVSPYCKACRAQQANQPKPSIARTLDLLGVSAESSPWLNATNALIAVNVIVFVAMVASGISWIAPTNAELRRWGADYGPDTLAGQYWRIVTSGFVHIGIIHILLNMWCLWSLGRLLERLSGRFVMASIYLVTAAGASLLSLSWDPMRVSAGASGAIFGIAGALVPILYFGKLNLPPENIRRLLGYVVRFAFINLLYGLRGHIDNMAHLGGLVTGLVAGLFLARSFSLPQEDQGGQRRMVMAVTAVAVALCVIPVARAKNYAVEFHKGEVAYDKHDYSSAIEHFQKYAAAQPDDPVGHALLGGSFQGVKRYDEAVAEYERGLALRPNYPFIQVNLGEVYLLLKQPDKAVQQFKAGIPGIKPKAPDYYLYAEALKESGSLAEAEQAAREAIRLDDKDAYAQSLLAEILKEEQSANSALPVKHGTNDSMNRKQGSAKPTTAQ
jgi:rhomboid protease GluP